ncbi:MAG TPA: plantaricin C family lantibiotic [Pseudobacteroides sp.]|uniref:plantaricin C family lantibiotic n=1 Tax=Pseudobacteroides sp. TaxID=1968840 RepID=UPI002F9382BA
MMNSNLLKNHILRNKVSKEVNNPAGNLAQEIQEQDLNGQAGGTLWTTVTTVTVVTPTPVARCGRVYTVSAECNGGTRCA